jgi:2-polyprenyl-6-methoxyphenol hydroxylase-like FAD-dependent oxidoreductase
LKLPPLAASVAPLEIAMKSLLLVTAIAVLTLAAADGASARVKKQAQQPRCADRPYEFSWGGIWTNPRPQPTGCAPPVYQHGGYVGQDPDPNIRFQLLRDPATGYGAGNY